MAKISKDKNCTGPYITGGDGNKPVLDLYHLYVYKSLKGFKML